MKFKKVLKENPPSIPDIYKDVFYERLSKQIEREDSLVNIRLGWMLTTQALLFAAFALVASKETRHDVFMVMKLWMPLMGAGISLVSLLGVLGAHRALRYLKGLWNIELPHYPPPFGDKYASTLGFIPSLFLPFIFILIWLSVLYKLNIPASDAVLLEKTSISESTVAPGTLLIDSTARR